MPGVRTDHEHDAAPPDHPAALAHRLYGRSYLHRPSWVVSINNLREKALPHHESRGGHNEIGRRPTRKYSSACVIVAYGTSFFTETVCWKVGRFWNRPGGSSMPDATVARLRS